MAIDAIGFVVRSITQHLNTILQRALSKELREVESCIKAADIAFTGRAALIDHPRRIGGIGNVTFNHHRRFAGYHQEIGAGTI